MRIAVDYDGVISEKPEYFADFIRLGLSTGIEVCIVTMRRKDESQPIEEFLAKHLAGLDVRVYYTGRLAKAEFMDGIGCNVNVWVDDNPKWILHSAKSSFWD